MDLLLMEAIVFVCMAGLECEIVTINLRFRCGSELRLIRLVIWYACENSSVLSIDYGRKFYCLPCVSAVFNNIQPAQLIKST